MSNKKWKIIKIITTLILCVFLIFCICKAVKIYHMNTNYPYEALGAIKINNWMQEFLLEMTMTLYMFGIPLIVDIVFLIISIIKLNRQD